MTSTIQQLPLGRSGFPALRDSNAIYVDKTEMVCKLAENDGKLFFARPRRFGKSLLISTFETLFKNGLRDFKGLAIEKLWRTRRILLFGLIFLRLRIFEQEKNSRSVFSVTLLRTLAKSAFNLKKGKVLRCKFRAGLETDHRDLLLF